MDFVGQNVRGTNCKFAPAEVKGLDISKRFRIQLDDIKFKAPELVQRAIDDIDNYYYQRTKDFENGYLLVYTYLEQFEGLDEQIVLRFLYKRDMNLLAYYGDYVVDWDMTYAEYEEKLEEEDSKISYDYSNSSKNWSHYNSDLDMDQQSGEFWNQF